MGQGQGPIDNDVTLMDNLILQHDSCSCSNWNLKFGGGGAYHIVVDDGIENEDEDEGGSGGVND